jgi:hypothetical protein
MKTASFVLATIVGLGAGCGGHHGKLVADSPALPYEKPDISEITGIDEDDSTSGDESAPAPAPAPAAAAAPAPKPAAAPPAPPVAKPAK